MSTENIFAEIDGTMDELLQLLSPMDEEQLNVLPPREGWTAGQVARHLVMSSSGFVEVLNGPVRETDRPPDEWVEQIKADFQNFGIKMQSPEFVVPPRAHYRKEELLQPLTDIQAQLRQAGETLDLTLTCAMFALPVYGHLTRLEILSFVLYHTQRHIRQLKRIQGALIRTETAAAIHPA
jgi:hypothetical protein